MFVNRSKNYDVERILKRWFKNVAPATVLRQVIQEWPIDIRIIDMRDVSKHCLLNRTIFVQTGMNREEESEVICSEWVNYRVHQKTGHPCKDFGFIQEWVREYFLPARLLESNRHFLNLQWMAIRGEGDIGSMVRDIASDFGCTPGLVSKAMEARGILDKNGALRKHPVVTLMPSMTAG